jgi:hypothetical protein
MSPVKYELGFYIAEVTPICVWFPILCFTLRFRLKFGATEATITSRVSRCRNPFGNLTLLRRSTCEEN